MTVYADELKQLDDAWAKTPVEGSSDLPPDGEYQAHVERFDFIRPKNQENALLLKTELRVTHPSTFQGYPIELLHSLTDPGRLKFTKKHLTAMGVTPERLSDIEQSLPNALDAIVEVVVKTSDRTNDAGERYRNAYVNNVIRFGHADLAPGAPPTAPPGAPEIPQSASQGMPTDDIPFIPSRI